MRSLIIAVSLALTCAALAENSRAAPSQDGPVVWEPPRLNISDNLPHATIAKPIVTTLRVGQLQIALENTELSATEKWLGASVGQRGDASEYIAWLCVCGSDAGGRWALWLESSEVAGGAIDGFALQRIDSTARPDGRCRVLPPRNTVVTSPRRLRLGMTKAQILKILGRPTAIDHGTMIWEHEHTETVHSEPYTAVNTVYILFDHGAATRIQVWKDTTN